VSPKTTAKDIEESRRIPDRSEVKAVLDEYFVGPITEEIVTKLTDYVVRVMQDKPLHWGEMDKFHPQNRRAFGKAWREVLSYDRDYPRSIDLAAWLASSTDGYPAAKPYCPDLYIGTWKDHDPETPYTWQFGSDGRFHTDEPICAGRIRWCLHRRGKPDPKGDVILLQDELAIGHQSVLIHDVTPTLLVIQPVYMEDTYRLVRV
jgi:hypothetical protein